MTSARPTTRNIPTRSFQSKPLTTARIDLVPVTAVLLLQVNVGRLSLLCHFQDPVCTAGKGRFIALYQTRMRHHTRVLLNLFDLELERDNSAQQLGASLLRHILNQFSRYGVFAEHVLDFKRLGIASR